MPIIESAKGIIKAYEIATASPQIVAMAIGLEDYTADIGISRSPEGKETLYARSVIVNACVAAGIQPIDSVFSDIENMDALAKAAGESKATGFRGMGCIHPRQIEVIREQFMPSESELEKAQKIMLAWEKAQLQGSAVVALESKMIDPPVVKRAIKTIENAVKSGRLAAKPKEGHE
jgi:citrate lyase subunit beta/citryl-CoA lyase